MPLRQPFDRIDIHLVRVLHTLIAERSVSRAAVRLGSGQPLVSAQLKRLRDLTGDPVLVRSGSSMSPTDAALAMDAHARQLLQVAEMLFSPRLHQGLGDGFVGLARNPVVRCAHFGLLATMVAENRLVLTTGRLYCQQQIGRLPVCMIRCPVAFPALRYFQLWHDLTHASPAMRWFREQVRDVARALVARRDE